MKRRPVMMLVLSVVASILLVPVSSYAAPTSVTVTGQTTASLLGHLDGSVSVGHCKKTVTTYSSAFVAATLKSMPNPYIPCFDPANKTVAVSKGGLLFVVAISSAPNNWNQVLMNFNRDGSYRWGMDPPGQPIVQLAMGSDGNVYGISSNTAGSISYLFGYTTRGVQVLNQ